MYGDAGLRSDDSGQLALMDALIFFVVATVVSGLVLADAMPERRAANPLRSIDAHEMLRVLLSASIGEPATVSTGAGTCLPGDTSVGDCLFFELMALQQGSLRSTFASLESTISRAMVAVCGSALDPHMVAYIVGGMNDEPALAIPGMPQDKSYGAAASIIVPGGPDVSWLLVLTLAAPALPEL